MIIGRYVSVNSVKSGEDQAPVAVVEERQTGAAVSDEAMEEADSKTGQIEADSKAGQEEAAAKDGIGKAEEEYADPEQIDKGAEEPADAAGEVMMDAEEPMDAAEEVMMDAVSEPADTAGEAKMDAAAPALTIPNPFVDTKTLEEAEKEAGFSIVLPEGTKPYDRKIYRAMKGQMIEVIYVDEDNREVYRIRKGKNMEDDISGIYFTHAVSDTLQSGSLKITVNGEEKDQWTAAVWTQEEEDGTKFSYSICSGQTFMEEDEITKMAEEMMAETITQPR